MLTQAHSSFHRHFKYMNGGASLYWELTFSDPLGTRPAGHAPSVAYLEYDWIQAGLLRVHGPDRQEIPDVPPARAQTHARFLLSDRL
jgi:hypothetical protein